MGRAAKDIFADAIELSPGERTRYIEVQCAGDAALRAEVERLLGSHGRAGEFLGSPTVAVSGEMSGGVSGGVRGGSAGGNEPPTAPPGAMGEEPGGRIGPYKLLQQIGEGGFGVVFMAEQEKPVQRRVALKIVKLGMDTRQVVARFDQERQALALMDHPNIARVLDAGATATGRPYFVMELVKGDAITEYCDRNYLSIADRLELFGQVCRAVQHAHTKGVIHRDLKPNNVLVSTQDGRAQAKVIDFGIAKATAARLTEKTLFTEFRQLVGTPQYMSPEQADGSLDIDTRTDVYSLGVLLYELLTGLTPFDPERLRSAAFGEIQRIIREVEPEKPSTRLSHAAQTLATVAALRHTDPRTLTRGVRGDLDLIVMKAMEKDRARRYETAEALAADVGRHLRDEPVAATSPSTVYRARKFLKRHRSKVAVAVLFVLLLGAFAAYAQVQSQRNRRLAQSEERAKTEALDALAKARLSARELERSSGKLKEVQEFFLDDLLGSADVYDTGNQKLTVIQAMDIAALRAGTIRDPEARSAVEHEIGSVYLSAQALDKAREFLQRALADRRSLGPAAAADTTATMLKLANVLRMDGQTDSAEQMVREARQMRVGLFGEASREVVEADFHLAETLQQAQQLANALETIGKALATLDRLDPPGQETVLHARVLSAQGRYLATNLQYTEALEPLQRAIAIRRRVEQKPTAGLATSLSWVGTALSGLRRFDDARKAGQEALQIREAIVPPGHPLIAQSCQSMGVLELNARNWVESERLEQRALELYRAAYQGQNALVAQTQSTLALALMRQETPEKLAEAAALYDQAISTFKALEGSGTTVPKTDRLAQIRGQYGRCLMLLRRFEEAELALNTAREVLDRAGQRPDMLQSLVQTFVDLYGADRMNKPEELAKWKARQDAPGPAK